VNLQDVLRKLPGVDAVLETAALAPAVARHGRTLAVAEVRRELERLRQAARRGEAIEGTTPEAVAGRVVMALDERSLGRLVEVLNATGVIVHTNLGRAPLGDSALRRIAERAAGATNLEMDLETGRRGRRAEGCEEMLVELTGAEAALVVNNCAAALLLGLNTFASGKGVLVSRGELVEIGGSFRIPAICERSGARLVEVGTTNRTRSADYERALDAAGDVGLLLKVHPSNFRVVGFTEEATIEDLVALGRSHHVPVMMDQGSGALEDLAPWGVDGEPAVPQLVAAGADLVAFSGDKLLGGPQAGCVVGRRDAIQACRSNPLFRALRVGRLTAVALEATLWAHASGHLEDVPVLAQLREGLEDLRRRAERIADAIRGGAAEGIDVATIAGASTSGGGSSPGARIATVLVRVAGPGVDAELLSGRLRRGRPAVVARIADDALLLDPRTVPPDRDDALARAVSSALAVSPPE
jgi:L-seryl-tRNA(Ser) seleniumtransferase